MSLLCTIFLSLPLCLSHCSTVNLYRTYVNREMLLNGFHIIIITTFYSLFCYPSCSFAVVIFCFKVSVYLFAYCALFKWSTFFFLMKWNDWDRNYIITWIPIIRRRKKWSDYILYSCLRTNSNYVHNGA